MRYLFELSKDHKTLPTAEVLSCLNAEENSYTIVCSNEDVLVVDVEDNGYEKVKVIADRLASSFYINGFLFSCPALVNVVKKFALEHSIEKKGSIAVKHRNRSTKIDSQSIIKVLADIYTEGKKVDLEKPDIEVRVVITDSNVYVGLKLFKINRSQYEKRKVQFRPFFSPISLHPKLARILVNLSCIKKHDTLLDPFCGTGGILLEAGLIGAKVIGSDIEEKMIEGCKKTLDHYNIKNYELFCCDIGDIAKHVKNVDAVVTDLPYGKSTTTHGETPCSLYPRAFENICKVLKRNGRAVVGLSDESSITTGSKYLTLLEKHEIRVHRSLTRFFAVYKKQP